MNPLFLWTETTFSGLFSQKEQGRGALERNLARNSEETKTLGKAQGATQKPRNLAGGQGYAGMRAGKMCLNTVSLVLVFNLHSRREDFNPVFARHPDGDSARAPRRDNRDRNTSRTGYPSARLHGSQLTGSLDNCVAKRQPGNRFPLPVPVGRGLREGEETECPDVEARTVRNSGSLHRPSLRRVAGTQHALRDGSGEDHAPPLPRLSAIRHSALSWLTKT